MADEGFRVDLLEQGRAARLIGELDLAAYDVATDALSHLFEAAHDVTLDVSRLSFVDSSGIRLFIRLHQSLTGGRLVLRSPTPHVARVLEIAGLPDLGIRIEGE